MSRYVNLFSVLRARVTPEMTPEDLERLAEPLERLNQKEAATARAYKICGCGAEYTEMEWTHLLPVPGREWDLDHFILEEWRECAKCGASLAVLESNGRRRPPDTMPFKAVSRGYHCCGACMRIIRPNSIFIERLEKRNGMRAAFGRWAFCSLECEEW